MKNTDFSKFTKIEQVAKMLVDNGISFQYEKNYLKVNDSEFSYNYFDTATYHTSTKELILMDSQYNKTN